MRQQLTGVALAMGVFLMAAAARAEGQAARPKAVIETTKGTITVELYNDLAPKTVENFTKLAK